MSYSEDYQMLNQLTNVNLIKKALFDTMSVENGNCYLYRRLLVDYIVKNVFTKTFKNDCDYYLKLAIEEDFFDIGTDFKAKYLFDLVEGDNSYDCSQCQNDTKCDMKCPDNVFSIYSSRIRFLMVSMILKYEKYFKNKGFVKNASQSILNKIEEEPETIDTLIEFLLNSRFLEFTSNGQISSEDIYEKIKKYSILDNHTINFNPVKSVDCYINQYTNNKEQESSCSESNKKSTAIEDLNNFIGLENVKKQINELNNLLLFRKMSKGIVNLPEINLHCFFEGNPGTGKTMVAKMYSKMLYELGLIKTDTPNCVSVNDLIAEHIGGTAIKTAKVIQKSLGGVLFIDEAYQLAPRHEKDFSYECIATIVREITEHKNDLVIIFAGYKDEMERLMNVNPGLKSRITNRISFDDYSPEELSLILKSKTDLANFILPSEVNDFLFDLIKTESKKKDFGNARFIENLLQEIILKHSVNVVTKSKSNDNISDEVIRTITLEDVTSL